MPNFLSVESTFFTVLNYPVSFIEFFGTVFYFASVWLIARKNWFTWPVGIASVILYMVLFYQFALYSDALEQIYYLGASTYGWLIWRKARSEESKITTGFSSKSTMAYWLLSTITLGFSLGFVMSSIHLWAPEWFPVPASFAYLDALTTVMSFSAMWLLILKRAESWIYWILVDLGAIYLYFTKGIMFVGFQYVILTGIAVFGLYSWVGVRGGNSLNESKPQ